jgi:thioesterase domain-containing protein
MAADTTQNLAEARLEMPDWASSPISRHLIGLTEKYQPLPSPDISIVVFRERDEYKAKPHPLRAWYTNHLPDGGWSRWTRRPNHIQWLAGDHGTVLKPPLVDGLAQAIRAAHDRHLQANPPPPGGKATLGAQVKKLGSKAPLVTLWAGAFLGE